jgi:hypothetical protein
MALRIAYGLSSERGPASPGRSDGRSEPPRASRIKDGPPTPLFRHAGTPALVLGFALPIPQFP